MSKFNYGAALKEKREEKSITQIVAADEIGISLQTLRNIEQGQSPRSDEVRDKLDNWLKK